MFSFKRPNVSSFYIYLLPMLAAFAIPAQAGYKYAAIDYPGAQYTVLFGINDNGTAIGEASLDGVSTISFAYDIGKHTFTVLPNVPGYDTSAIGINDYGAVVGSVYNGSSHGFILYKGAFSIFDHPGSLSCANNAGGTIARGVNNWGVVTGYADTGDCNTVTGFIYDPNSNTYTDFLPAGFTIAHGINNVGVVVGSTDSPVGYPALRYGFVRSKSGALTLFRVNNFDTRARGINDNGIMAGYTSDGQGFVIPAPLGSGVKNLTVGASKLVNYPGAASSTPEGINNSGVVVGIWADGAQTSHGFVATPTK